MKERNPLQPSKGTILKISVVANLGDAHMEDVDFTCQFFTNHNKTYPVTHKSKMLRISEDEYIAVVDSDILGTGEYFVKFTAYIPDTDVDGDIRKEIVTIPTGITVV